MTDDDLRYLAVVDPAEPALMTYWRRMPSGGVKPWPEKSKYGPRLLKSQVPADMKGTDRAEYVRAWFQRVSNPWHDQITAAIEADPQGCAARFAQLQTRCICCGRVLTDPESKVYGIGPDCRRGFSDEEGSEWVESVGRAQARAELVRRRSVAE